MKLIKGTSHICVLQHVKDFMINVDILTIMNASDFLPNCEGLPQTNCYDVPFSDQLPQGLFFFPFSFFHSLFSTPF